MHGNQCLDAPCYQSKVAAHVDREIAAHPNLIQIETVWRNPKQQKPGALTRGQFRELPKPVLPENVDAEPVRSCDAERTAIVIFGKEVGTTLPICTDDDCPVHTNQPNPQTQRQTVVPDAAESLTEEHLSDEEAQKQRQQFQHDQERRNEERKREFDRQHEEQEADNAKRVELQKTRDAAFERILETAPAMFSAAQMRVFLRALVSLDSYTFSEVVAEFFARDHENHQQTPEELLLSILDGLADDKLTGFALRLALTGHKYIPREGDRDFLS